MSDPQNRVPQTRKSAAAMLMIIIGIVLLLPGLCSLFFIAGFALSGSLWILWGICFVVAIGGALLLRLGWRR
jgi:hypothetical protein